MLMKMCKVFSGSDTHHEQYITLKEMSLAFGKWQLSSSCKILCGEICGTSCFWPCTEKTIYIFHTSVPQLSLLGIFIHPK